AIVKSTSYHVIVGSGGAAYHTSSDPTVSGNWTSSSTGGSNMTSIVARGDIIRASGEAGGGYIAGFNGTSWFGVYTGLVGNLITIFDTGTRFVAVSTGTATTTAVSSGSGAGGTWVTSNVGLDATGLA